MNPVLLVIAGPNGSGKTTVTELLRKDHWSEGGEYINPDEIAQDRFGDWNSPEAVRAAAVWATQRREDLLRQHAGIAFETVLSAPDKLAFVARAVEAGYFVRVFFVATSSPTINAARVAQRVMRGGHTVPIDKIISRRALSRQSLGGVARRASRLRLRQLGRMRGWCSEPSMAAFARSMGRFKGIRRTRRLAPTVISG